MIVKRNFHPLKVVRYVRTELLLSVLFSLAVYLLHANRIITIALPFSIVAILGSASAIFIAFRNNSAYSRWWEARTLWGSIVNNSRIFARQIIANADHAAATGKASLQKADAYKKEMVYRQIAFAHLLRLQLRRETGFDECALLLSASELAAVSDKHNPANLLLLNQGIRVKEGMKEEILGAFDNISIEPTLAGFNNFQGACERIKNTPLLRQYDFFTRLFLYVFIFLLPLCLVGDFAKLNSTWLMVPVSVVIAFVFSIIGKVGEVNEDPFENRITDVPLTSISNTIERDLRSMLNEKNLPEPLTPKDGYLF